MVGARFLRRGNREVDALRRRVTSIERIPDAATVESVGPSAAEAPGASVPGPCHRGRGMLAVATKAASTAAAARIR